VQPEIFLNEKKLARPERRLAGWQLYLRKRSKISIS